jgi:hypothetical protein
MMENHYKTSASSTNSLIFLIKLRLDISNLLSTKKKLLPEDHERSPTSLKATAGEANNPP